MESNAMSLHEDVFTKFFPQGIDLNPARMVIAEMMGTFVLMICVCGIIGTTQLTRDQLGLLEYATTAGLTVIVLVFSIGPISGAHVNPAITIAFATFGHFPWSRVPFYVSAQIVGSALASYAGGSIYGIKPDLMTTRPFHGCSSAFWVEFIATFIIMFVAASLAYQTSVRQLSGFVLGVAIALAVLITGRIVESCKVIRACNCFQELQGHMGVYYCANLRIYHRCSHVSCPAYSTPAMQFYFLS
ncbi:probable aquaporin NIP7-1 isoform X2 [Jatropha curcas]|uniref:probable aquaporin NIP7-1 isoform X2 n=1 Tax=Jatropha curcas TaxID=180498 RepID=UPI001893BC2E|nr:probable aquaporin NIP7-1 isoform X2 [Jatropha curcas]